MKLAVVGSRTWNQYLQLENVLCKLYPPPTEIVSGGAAGVDTLASTFAKAYGLPLTVFKPDWKQFGKAAGAIRNQEIVDYCDQLIAFWDGKSKGTVISIHMAAKAGKLLRIVEVPQEYL